MGHATGRSNLHFVREGATTSNSLWISGNISASVMSSRFTTRKRRCTLQCFLLDEHTSAIRVISCHKCRKRYNSLCSLIVSTVPTCALNQGRLSPVGGHRHMFQLRIIVKNSRRYLCQKTDTRFCTMRRRVGGLMALFLFDKSFNKSSRDSPGASRCTVPTKTSLSEVTTFSQSFLKYSKGIGMQTRLRRMPNMDRTRDVALSYNARYKAPTSM